MVQTNNLTGVLLAAGKGLRAYPSTKFLPKPLFKVDGETLLLKNINILINDFKVKEIHIVVGHFSDKIISYVNQLKLNIKISFTLQKEINGIANALYLLKDNLKNEKFVVILADEYYHNPGHEDLKNKILQGYSSILTFVKEKNFNIIKKNFIGKFKDDKIIDLEEKPKIVKDDMMGVGTYFFDDKVFEYIEKNVW